MWPLRTLWLQPQGCGVLPLTFKPPGKKSQSHPSQLSSQTVSCTLRLSSPSGMLSTQQLDRTHSGQINSLLLWGKESRGGAGVAQLCGLKPAKRIRR